VNGASIGADTRSPERRSVSDAREKDPLPEVGRRLASETDRLPRVRRRP
jgi:hypothetical protein